MKSCQVCDPKVKIEKVMHEFKEGKLNANGKNGKAVTSRKQAVAIAFSASKNTCSCKK